MQHALNWSVQVKIMESPFVHFYIQYVFIIFNILESIYTSR